MKKINPFKLYATLFGVLIFVVSLGFAIAIHTINYVNSDPNKITYSVDTFKLVSNTPFYDMYDAYEYIMNDKLILMSEKQIYEIEKYKKHYYMKDIGTTQVNAIYNVDYEKLEVSPSSYEHHEKIYNGNLYIKKSLDYPKGIEFTFICENKDLSYTVYLTILDIDNIGLDSYINKIKNYIILVENHNI